MKEKVGGLEAKCDQYHSYITELREMIQSVKILQGLPEGHLGGVLHLMSS